MTIPVSQWSDVALARLMKDLKNRRENMNLTLQEKAEIKQIISGFTDEDYSVIDPAVELLCRSIHPVLDMLESHKPGEHTRAAVEWLGEEDCKYQDFAGEFMWDIFRSRVEVEYAIAIFHRRHSLEDQA